VHRGRNDVVARLAVVGVVVGVDDAVADLAAHEFGGAVGDDLVRVHIRRGPGAGLEDIDRELVVVFASDDLVGGLDDRLGDVVVDQAEVAVGLCGGLLDDAEPADESATERDPEIGKFPMARWVWAPQ